MVEILLRHSGPILSSAPNRVMAGMFISKERSQLYHHKSVTKPSSNFATFQVFFRFGSFPRVYKYLPPATKLGQGNFFRSVCQKFCPGRGGACMSHDQHYISSCIPVQSQLEQEQHTGNIKNA